jgi:hypothetical protein
VAVGKGAPHGTASEPAGIWPVVLLALQLGGLLALIIGLRIENPAFYGRVAPLAMGGALVNHLLPRKYRLAFFSLLSIAGIWLVFGTVQGAWVVSIGLAFILICHLPAAFGLRVALLVLAAVALATLRAGLFPAPWSPAIWSIVGSMLMFRLIVYAYELSHLKGTIAWPERLAYFFCLPNVTFPLFPVIDFSTFRRTYYDRPAMGIYQEGIAWILRGLAHLVGYRLVYQYGTLSPAEVRSGTDLVIYVMANFGLYLRVSGQFHLIIGILHLFGFRLPETHRFFYLASSFSDLWRRINIYWKDFMQKVFYMPLLFRLKKTHGETFSMVASTILVFVVTWFFHSYQWFWLLGTWLWSTTDTLFWAFLGACLIANSLYELRAGRTRSLAAPRPTTARLLRHGAQTASMFAVMALLWALWTSPTMGAFADLLGNAQFGARDAGVVLATWALVATIAALTFRRTQAAGAVRTTLPRWASPATAAALAIIPLGNLKTVSASLPPAASAVLARASDVQLNKRDQEELQRGYYEKIVGVNRFNNELWRVYSLRPTEWIRLDSTGAVRPTEDDRLEELVPGWSEMFHGGRLTINSQGLRDREYDLAKPEGVFRIVLLGQSYVLGEGVNDGETFESLLEERLTADDAQSLGYTRIEILNFGAPAYSAMQQRADLVVGRVGKWQPDAVIVVGHFREFAQIDDYFMSYMRQRPKDRIPVSVSRWIDSAGIQPTMTSQEATRRMAPFASQILRETYHDMVRRIDELGATPVFAYIPTPATRANADVLARYLETTKDAGFAAWLDLRDAYQGLDESTLTIAEWDHHPNATGHRRLAERLHAELRARPELWRRRNAPPGVASDRGDERAATPSSAPPEPAATRRP